MDYSSLPISPLSMSVSKLRFWAMIHHHIDHFFKTIMRYKVSWTNQKKKRKKKKKEKIKIVLICKIHCISDTFLLTLYWLKVTQTPQCNFVQALFSETVDAWKVVRKSSYFKSLLSLMSYLLKLHYPTNRSSHRRCSVRKDVLWNFAKFTGKHLCQSLFFNKVPGWGLQLH